MKHFKFWAQKTLPLVYDDSLSYYEVLSKLTKYVNDLIDANEELQEKLSSLLDALSGDEGEVLQRYGDGELEFEFVDDFISAGDGIYLSEDKEISVKVDGTTITFDSDGKLKAIDQSTHYEAGNGIQISNGNISAKVDGTTVQFDSNGKIKAVAQGTEYEAGNGIQISDNAISAKVDGSTVQFDSQGRLKSVGGASYQAGNGIEIDNNTIKAKVDNDSIIFDSNGKLKATHTNYTWGNGILIVSGRIQTRPDLSTIGYDDTGALTSLVKPVKYVTITGLFTDPENPVMDHDCDEIWGWHIAGYEVKAVLIQSGSFKGSPSQYFIADLNWVRKLVNAVTVGFDASSLNKMYSVVIQQDEGEDPMFFFSEYERTES